MGCSLCNSLKLHTIDDGNKLYYHCQNCDFIFLDSQYILSNKEEKSRYENHQNDIANDGYVAMFETFIAQIFLKIKSVKKVLDYGCGPGPVLAQLLKQKGYAVWLYDKYFYEQKNNLQKKYDLIVCTEVFEHLKDPKQILQQFKQMLYPGGYIAVMTQFHPQDNEKFKRWYYKIDDTHIGFFTQHTFLFLAQELSMELLYTDNKNVVLFKV